MIKRFNGTDFVEVLSVKEFNGVNFVEVQSGKRCDSTTTFIEFSHLITSTVTFTYEPEPMYVDIYDGIMYVENITSRSDMYAGTITFSEPLPAGCRVVFSYRGDPEWCEFTSDLFNVGTFRDAGWYGQLSYEFTLPANSTYLNFSLTEHPSDPGQELTLHIYPPDGYRHNFNTLLIEN